MKSESQSVPTNRNVADKILVLDFMANNKWYLLLFLGVVLLTMPLEAVVLPNFYSKLFGNLRSPGTVKVLLCILALWAVVVSCTGLKAGIENVLIPDYR